MWREALLFPFHFFFLGVLGEGELRRRRRRRRRTTRRGKINEMKIYYLVIDTINVQTSGNTSRSKYSLCCGRIAATLKCENVLFAVFRIV